MNLWLSTLRISLPSSTNLLSYRKIILLSQQDDLPNIFFEHFIIHIMVFQGYPPPFLALSSLPFSASNASMVDLYNTLKENIDFINDCLDTPKAPSTLYL